MSVIHSESKEPGFSGALAAVKALAAVRSPGTGRKTN